MSDEQSISGKAIPRLSLECVQVGVVVKDLDNTVRKLSEVFGIGPFRIVVQPPPDRDDIEQTYKGERVDSAIRIAYTDLGPIELEVIEPLRGPSIWHDFLEQHGEGIQHIRFNTTDIAAATESLAKHGIDVIHQGTGISPGVVWSYFDTAPSMGFTIEVVQRPES
jgi:hypothetical protein